jgi:hypothetical protein
VQELALRDCGLCRRGERSGDQRAAEQRSAGECVARAHAKPGEEEQRSREDDAAAQKIVPVREERGRPAGADDEERDGGDRATRRRR